MFNKWLSCDNVEGEWYIGYHGTGSNEIIGKIIIIMKEILKNYWIKIYLFVVVVFI